MDEDDRDLSDIYKTVNISGDDLNEAVKEAVIRSIRAAGEIVKEDSRREMFISCVSAMYLILSIHDVTIDAGESGEIAWELAKATMRTVVPQEDDIL